MGENPSRFRGDRADDLTDTTALPKQATAAMRRGAGFRNPQHRRARGRQPCPADTCALIANASPTSTCAMLGWNGEGDVEPTPPGDLR